MRVEKSQELQGRFAKSEPAFPFAPVGVDGACDVGWNGYANAHGRERMMRRVQIRLDEELLASVDEAAKRLRTTRSGFTRRALREALDRLASRRLEEKHRQGYERYPVQAGEFDLR